MLNFDKAFCPVKLFNTQSLQHLIFSRKNYSCQIIILEAGDMLEDISILLKEEGYYVYTDVQIKKGLLW